MKSVRREHKPLNVEHNVLDVRLMGGLGNQMFQYALGCRLEFESDRPVRFDLSSGFQNDVYMRRPALDVFNTRVRSAEKGGIPIGMDWPNPWHKLAKLAWSSLPGSVRRVVYERKPFRFDEAVVAPSKANRYFFGYWQSPEYFSPVHDRLRRDFSLRQPLGPVAAKLLAEMQKCRAISVHVRLYLDIGPDGKVIEMARQHHGACPPDYYTRAVNQIGTSSETVCYVFSDKPGLAKQVLNLPAPCRYVADVGQFSDAEEMILMSACQHHVISNSSFSWWGAWLGGNPKKTVVAPSRWVNGLPPGDVQVCPKEWIQFP